MIEELSPVLVLAFNRPLLLKRVLKEISRAGVTNVYVNIDGPRQDNDDDAEKIRQSLKIIETYAQSMHIKTRRLEANLGCKKAVSSGIDWFFSQEEEGIILENDCLPSISFFRIMSYQLQNYRDDHRIFQISGFNPLGELSQKSDKVFSFLSRHSFIWGWATWRRAWEMMDPEMQSFASFSINDIHLTTDTLANRFIMRKWNETYLKQNNSWAYAWSYCVYSHGGLSVNFSKSLVENIGVDNLATHTKKSSHPWSRVARHEIKGLPALLDESIDKKRETDLFYAMHKPRYKLIVRFLLDKLTQKRTGKSLHFN